VLLGINSNRPENITEPEEIMKSKKNKNTLKALYTDLGDVSSEDVG